MTHNVIHAPGERGVSYPSPTDFANLNAYYDADLFAATADGTAVSAWHDLSGLGNDLAQGTGSKQPTVAANTFNKHPAVHFDGTDDFMTCSFAAISQPHTVIYAGKWHTSPAGTSRGMFDGAGTSTQRALLGESNGSSWYMYAGTVYTTGTFDQNQHIWVVIFNGASTKLYVDGGSATTGDSGTNAIAGITIGSERNQFSYAGVNVGAVAHFTGSVSVGNINAICRGFASRFGTTWTTAT